MKKIVLQVAILVFTAFAAMAQAPQQFNYQGVARSTAGAPLVSQPIGLRLTIHDGSASGTTVYQETQTPTTNAFGLYNIGLGSGTVVSGTFNTINWGAGAKYLQVEIDATGGSSYITAGTSELLSVPYSIYSNNAGAVTNGITGSGTTNYVPKFTGASALGNSMIIDNGATVGVNTATPTNMAKLHVSGMGTYSVAPYYQAGIVADGGGSLASGSGIYGEGGWRGVYGRNPGTASGSEAIGVLGRCEGSSYVATGYGVKGENAGTGGTSNYGVYGTASGAGRGVGGFATGTGAAGYFDGGTTGLGIVVPNGACGIGTVTPTPNAKLEVSGIGTSGSAIYSQAGIVADGATTLSATGVFGQAGWRGVFGYNTGGTSGVQAIGVQGTVAVGSLYTQGYGVYGSATAVGPTNYGVYGTASGGTTANYAGYFAGNVTITGSISKGSGTFKIDHPLDPENKYLYHSFVESPDMMNIYNGNITTDASGDATVTLPDYFEALNMDFRYQLTVLGTFAQAIILEKVNNNQFKIKTDKPNVEVSWQVTGVRHDKYANAHRVVTEVEKEPQFRGYYLHATEWGVPATKSIDALTTPSEVNNNKAK